MTAEENARGSLPLISFVFLFHERNTPKMLKKAGYRVDLPRERETIMVTWMDRQKTFFGVTLSS